MSDIQVKRVEVLDAVETLASLMNETFSGKIAYCLAKLHRACAKEANDYEAIRIALVKKLGKEIELNKWAVLPEHLEDFGKQINEMMNETITLCGVRKLTQQEIDTFREQPKTFQAILAFVEDTEEPL